jgi:hypothetical protein
MFAGGLLLLAALQACATDTELNPQPLPPISDPKDNGGVADDIGAGGPAPEAPPTAGPSDAGAPGCKATDGDAALASDAADCGAHD